MQGLFAGDGTFYGSGMPHLFLNRPRKYNLASGQDSAGKELFWESLNAFIYKIGGVIFIFGSVLFFPAFSAYEDLGAWSFVVGSLLYLLVTGHDLVEVFNARRHRTAPPTIWNRLGHGRGACPRRLSGRGGALRLRGRLDLGDRPRGRGVVAQARRGGAAAGVRPASTPDERHHSRAKGALGVTSNRLSQPPLAKLQVLLLSSQTAARTSRKPQKNVSTSDSWGRHA